MGSQVDDGRHGLGMRTLRRLLRQGEHPKIVKYIASHSEGRGKVHHVDVRLEIDPHDLEEQEILDELKIALMRHEADHGGRNSDCWPLGSFGWKDADLEASGCTGIKRIWGARGGKIVLEVGGRKTVTSGDCLPCLDNTEEIERVCQAVQEDFNSASHELVVGSGFHGEWSGDDWSLGFTSQVEVDAAIDSETGDVDYDTTVGRCLVLAQRACNDFEEEMQHISKTQDHMYQTDCESILCEVVQLLGPASRDAVLAAINDIYGDSTPKIKPLANALANLVKMVSAPDYPMPPHTEWCKLVQQARKEYNDGR